ncbi:DegT/DnrJ/EryC1/StrS aminotransferase family protein [Flavimaricola marinus]|uniref:DegT/DnrJ/EryC1/StrS aminotransferase family protein n=1 Tax=Flavimaricola marinus TaxID=1819565 RepID=A0A238LCL3_9RHOB|nr:DegT/DnrJ/EryC1/StrS aminotransferase family protein [Flavimaricola marinus]SMY07368.1 hypothetical protein LOM8899_01503 [Flavimaricola marinus]
MTAPADAPDPIGGFLGLERPGAGDLNAFWGAADCPAWVNATSALAALVTELRPARVWLPGYICAELVEAVPAAARRYFPMTDALAPDIAALDGRVADGDLVLAVDMFGRAPGPDWRDFVAAHPGVTFVEDCAQALDTGEAPWGDWRLFSPRKLVGVPEGGILVPITARAIERARNIGPAPEQEDAHQQARQLRLAPMLARRDAPQTNARWHAMHQAAEASHRIGDAPMSPAARALLSRLEPAPMIAARKRNFAQLAEALPDFAVISQTEPAFAPSGFAVRVAPEVRSSVLAHLHAHRIFAAVHWREIPAPPEFTRDHQLAASLITLPCDHRYGPPEMARVAATFLDACR